jgi:hypothetical protein
VNEFIALVPTDKFLDITLDYLYNDKEVKDFVAYVQSEEVPQIHKIVEHLKEYKDVSAFISINFKRECDRKNISLVSTGG